MIESESEVMNQPDGFKDVRKHARFELLEYAIVFEKESGEGFRSVVIDVSLGGLQVRSRHQFPTGVNYSLSIGRAEADPLVIEASARYCVPIDDTDLYATGFRCVPASTAQRNQWVDYVHHIFQIQGEHLVG